VNQALVFYHFGSVDELLTEACAYAARERVQFYGAQFDAVSSLSELVELGVRIHKRERAEGNILVLAQMLAGAQAEPKLAPAVLAALRMWIERIEAVLERVLLGSPLREFVDVPGMARALSAAFVGLGLYDGIDHEGADRALASLTRLDVLIEVIDDLGPAARALLRTRLRRAAPTD
jgi:AcrR family transcriptional regulator